MGTPKPVNPISSALLYLDIRHPVRIGNVEVDIPSLARAYQLQNTKDPAWQKEANQSLSYEDVQAFCRSKGMRDCQSVEQYNQMVRRLMFQDPRRFLQAWAEDRIQAKGALYNPPLNTYPPVAAIENQGAFIQKVAEIASASSFENFCRLLGTQASPGLRDFYWRRHFLVLALLEFSANSQEAPFKLEPPVFQSLQKLFREIAKKGPPSKIEDPFDDSQVGLRVTSDELGRVALLFGAEGVRLLKNFYRLCRRCDLGEDLAKSESLRVAFRSAAAASGETRKQIVTWFREETQRTGHVRHWLALQTQFSVEDLDFLMTSFRAFSPVQKKTYAKEFIESWAQINSGHFDPLRERKNQIEEFNLELILDPDVENYRTVKKEVDEGVYFVTREYLGTTKSVIYPLAAAHLRVPFSQKVLERVEQDLYEVYHLDEEDSPHIARDSIPDREKFIGPFHQYVVMSEKFAAPAQKVFYELLRNTSPEAFERTLRGLALEAERIHPEVKKQLLGMLHAQLQALRGGLPIYRHSRRSLHQIALLVETARKLGGRFEDFGESFADIEKRLYGYLKDYPGAGSDAAQSPMPRKYLSESGFLGWGDLLIPTLQEDEKKLKILGLTAQQVAIPLKMIRAYFFESGFSRFDVQINGRIYHVERQTHLWSQSCPFLDSTEDLQVDLNITDDQTGESFFFPSLLAHLIDEHGFFEGKNAGHWGGDEKISYRIEPESLIAFFQLKPGAVSFKVF